ncbi:hypothetical protein [Psychrobacter sp. AOP1-A1-60]|uniref:hypothetical protein n=1 Tax=Psychrobacter sp. AOP1-A1-60 TaxID=3457727 RepID=UPI0040367808
MSVSIFDNQKANELKERQRLEELKRKAKLQQVKLDKRLNKQKILMGAFLGQVLVGESEDEKFIQNYFAKNFPEFLTRKSDKELFKSMIESLGGDMGLDEEESSFVANAKENNQEAIDQNTGLENNQPSSSHQTQSDSMANYGEQDSLLDDHKYATDVSDPNYRGQ